ncbi:Eukaryotic aspartyl protease family protein [Perilla frutescens var. hirtella]|nr:Eukaryotic aspartyl protease family protein [Perilla frutescens var. hirtella]KAH6808062.1 Eukaryotic aspartyl protease family protein [Perilla frutescens var. frutescens]
MASCTSLSLLLFIVLFTSFHPSLQENTLHLSFPLTSVPLSETSASKASYISSLLAKKGGAAAASAEGSSPPFGYNYQSSFKYSMALIVSLPIGTPPQAQQMVVDTGSQLSWIQCHRKSPEKQPPPASFDPSLSSSFSVLPCNHPLCKPRIPDFTLPTTCDQKRLCHYSYFYADGTLAEGNLVREKFTFSTSQTTPPLILGCAAESAEAEGILGMNLGRLSFISQAKVPKFSYCVPPRQGGRGDTSGRFHLGENPNSRTFQYINLLTFPQSQRTPNFDPLAYTVGLVGIKIGGKKLNISVAAFRPDATGSGQTLIDSGTQYTFLVDAAYGKVREEVVRLVGPKMKKGYVYGGSLDMCFDGNAIEIGRSIGDMALEFEKGVEILIKKERVLDEVGGGVHCVAIGRSESLGVASNIIGNFHQQDLWVEFDIKNRQIGFGVADCTKSV